MGVQIFFIEKSPVFSHVSTTLHSLLTIRAYKAQAEFQHKFNSLQNTHSSVDFTRILLMNWFLFVVQFLAFIYFAVVTLSFMIIPSGKLGEELLRLF